MRNHKKALIALVTAVLAIVAGIGWLSQPAGATDEPAPVVKYCDQDNVDCGNFPEDPEDIPVGTPCQIKLDGEWLEGEVNDHGQCVCPLDEEEPTTTTVPEPTTTTTVVPTTTTVAPTTSTTAPAITTPPVPETTVPEVEFANCDEAIEAGAAPIFETDPGYAPNLDSDGDGIACEVDQLNPSPSPAPARPVVVSPDFTG